MSLSADTWSSMLKHVSSRQSLIQFKVMHRAHVSKAKLSHIYILGLVPAVTNAEKMKPPLCIRTGPAPALSIR